MITSQTVNPTPSRRGSACRAANSTHRGGPGPDRPYGVIFSFTRLATKRAGVKDRFFASLTTFW